MYYNCTHLCVGVPSRKSRFSHDAMWRRTKRAGTNQRMTINHTTSNHHRKRSEIRRSRELWNVAQGLCSRAVKDGSGPSGEINGWDRKEGRKLTLTKKNLWGKSQLKFNNRLRKDGMEPCHLGATGFSLINWSTYIKFTLNDYLKQFKGCKCNI